MPPGLRSVLCLAKSRDTALTERAAGYHRETTLQSQALPLERWAELAVDREAQALREAFYAAAS